jgi:DNA-directed RNA polymerase subunit RPC12/RpoP
MAAMTTLSKTYNKLVEQAASDYPQFKFKPGSQEHWSPKTNTITYEEHPEAGSGSFGLLHELAHALLAHNNYKSDFELLKLESQAWHKAAEIGRKYGIEIDEEHIQNCLDTYRDWLHRRSKCPNCGVHVLQKDARTYKCFNCGASWTVSAGRFARSYRLLSNNR